MPISLLTREGAKNVCPYKNKVRRKGRVIDKAIGTLRYKGKRTR